MTVNTTGTISASASVLGGILLIAPLLHIPTGDGALAAQNVGVAAAVLPQARGEQPNQKARVLRIGVDIVANERVATDAEGKLQLLFLDGSALTVGPNSEVVIDRFVYDPKAKSGALAFSATKGVFRLVGGKISKTTPVTLRTPQALIGIRGGIATARTTDNGVTATFLFGKEMSVESGGARISVDRPGFQISAQGGRPPSPPRRASDQQLATELNSLESNEDQADAAEVEVGNEDVADSQLAALGSNTEPLALASSVAVQPIAAQENTTVLENKANLTTASQQTTTDLVSGTGGLTLSGFFGRGKRGTSTATGTSDEDTTQNVTLSDITIVNGRFTATSSQGTYSLQGPSTTGEFTLAGLNSTPYGDVTGTGFLSDDSEFLVYELSGSQQLVFAGIPTALTDIPSSGVTTYNARDDFTLGGSKIPLIPTIHGGNLTPLTSAQATVYWGSADSSAYPAFFAGNLAISGTGSSQKHAVSLLVGQILTDSSSRPFLAGDSVGSSLISATGDYYFYNGEVSTQDAADGSDFFGRTGPDQAVIGSEQVSTSDAVTSRGIEENLRGAETFVFPNIPIIATTSSASLGSTRSTRVMAAYVGGVARDFDSGGNFLGAHKFYSINTTSTTTVDSVTVPVNRIQTNFSKNLVEGAFNFKSPLSDGIPDSTLDFGGFDTSLIGHSAFIDDGHFGAIGFESGSNGDPDIGIFRNTDISLSAITPSDVTFCTCSYVTWGFWGANDPSEHLHDIGLAAWVAGERVANSNLNEDASGSFSGTVIGTVANGTHDANGTVALYTAVGSYSFNLSIGASSVSVTSGSMSVDSASLTFTGSGSISVSTPTEFSGTLSGSRGATSLTGTIRGAFFGAPANSSSVPRNAAGFFAASDSGLTYQIGGVHLSEN
ncbi:MAG: FecR domain-containing protein [Alphaproteobacteria bacterium]|nr:FecR domain-containing protein [Alphaproteobacteria bacterium]